MRKGISMIDFKLHKDCKMYYEMIVLKDNKRIGFITINNEDDNLLISSLTFDNGYDNIENKQETILALLKKCNTKIIVHKTLCKDFIPFIKELKQNNAFDEETTITINEYEIETNTYVLKGKGICA